MRSVINISLPKSMAKEVEREVKAGKFASKSEFFRGLFRLWEEEKLLRAIRESEGGFARGEGKILRSLKDLR